MGPGRAVLIFGPAVAVMVLVVMESSERQWLVASDRWPVSSTSPRSLVEATLSEEDCAEDLLVATEEAGTQARRQIRPIAPRAHKTVQPALGQMRIGFVA